MTTREFLFSAWTWDPFVMIICVVAAFCYAAVFRSTLSRKSWFVLLGLAVFVVALVSPLNALEKGYLFSAHMLQHLLLLLIVPPLILLGLPEWRRPGGRTTGAFVNGVPVNSFFLGRMKIWALRALSPLTLALSPLAPKAFGVERGEGIGGAMPAHSHADHSRGSSLSPLNGERAGVRGEANQECPNFSPSFRAIFGAGRPLMHPITTWLAGVGAMWIWHVPALCDTAASSQPVHYLQVVSLLLLGGMFWWPILGPQADQRLLPLAGVAYLFSACVGCSLLGILITFAPVGVCPIYLHPEDRLGILPLIRERWGLTPAVDQQVGGLLMWVPACLVYLCGIIGLLARWYRDAEEEGRAFFQNPKSEIRNPKSEVPLRPLPEKN